MAELSFESSSSETSDSDDGEQFDGEQIDDNVFRGGDEIQPYQFEPEVEEIEAAPLAEPDQELEDRNQRLQNTEW